MIFKLDKGFVPEVYSESKDYRVFLKLLGILVSVFKVNIDTVPDLYSAENCPEHLVNLLAGMVGYKYNDSISVEDNRLIIKYFPYMIRRRGSRQGLKLATALSLNTSPSAGEAYTLDNVIIEYDFDTGMIKIYYPHTDDLRHDLIEYVRPVGTFINFIKSTISESTDELDIKATARAEIKEYDSSKNQVDRSQVGFGSSIVKERGDNS